MEDTYIISNSRGLSSDIPDAPWIREAERYGGEDYPEPICPECYAESPDTAYYQDGEVIGCDLCIDYDWDVEGTCPVCGGEWEMRYYPHGGKDILGCDLCIEARDIDMLHSNPAFYGGD